MIGSHRRGTVLLLDDEDTVLVPLERQFRAAGLNPISTQTIAGAWGVISAHVVHGVVADDRIVDPVTGARESGAEFLVDLGRSNPGIGRVLISGFLDGPLSQRASENGFVALDKGCKFRELLAVVNLEIGNG